MVFFFESRPFTNAIWQYEYQHTIFRYMIQLNPKLRCEWWYTAALVEIAKALPWHRQTILSIRRCNIFGLVKQTYTARLHQDLHNSYSINATFWYFAPFIHHKMLMTSENPWPFFECFFEWLMLFPGSFGKVLTGQLLKTIGTLPRQKRHQQDCCLASIPWVSPPSEPGTTVTQARWRAGFQVCFLQISSVTWPSHNQEKSWPWKGSCHNIRRPWNCW